MFCLFNIKILKIIHPNTYNKMSRLDQLFDFLKDEPDDPFILYAIATEYTKTDLNKARKYYEKLLNEHPGYIAAYYHAAKLYEETGETDLALKTYEKGIETAKAQKESLALRELNNAYNELLME